MAQGRSGSRVRMMRCGASPRCRLRGAVRCGAVRGGVGWGCRYKEVVAAVDMEDKELRRTLQSLACAKHKVAPHCPAGACRARRPVEQGGLSSKGKALHSRAQHVAWHAARPAFPRTAALRVPGVRKARVPASHAWSRGPRGSAQLWRKAGVPVALGSTSHSREQ
jgi:hypothetical protein